MHAPRRRLGHCSGRRGDAGSNLLAQDLVHGLAASVAQLRRVGTHCALHHTSTTTTPPHQSQQLRFEHASDGGLPMRAGLTRTLRRASPGCQTHCHVNADVTPLSIPLPTAHTPEPPPSTPAITTKITSPCPRSQPVQAVNRGTTTDHDSGGGLERAEVQRGWDVATRRAGSRARWST